MSKKVNEPIEEPEISPEGGQGFDVKNLLLLVLAIAVAIAVGLIWA